MSVPYRHIRHQGPVIAGLGRVALAAAAQSLGVGPAPLTTLPGPVYTAIVPPRDRQLVADYVRWAGGDPGAWKGRVPPHLFPQWGFPLLTRTLEGIRYPISKVLNAGCKIEVRAPIPDDTPLHLSAQLVDIDDDGRRVLLTQRLVTAAPDGTELCVATFFALIPLPRKKDDGGKKPAKKTPPLVPVDAQRVGARKLAPDAGLAFACLTGDFNPIHWLKPYAAAAGFGRTILHGFGTLALAVETIRRARQAGAVDWPATLEVRFTRPLKLPARVAVFVHGSDFYVGPAPGAPAYLTGSFTPASEASHV
ncbi:MAG: MaoC/PaaZ C-terminal domain-containing protein [bacterium]